MNKPNDSKAPFASLLREWEAVATDSRDSDRRASALEALSSAVAYSVLAKVTDPQRKAAAEKTTVSDNGYSPAIVALRRGLAADIHHLDSVKSYGEAWATGYTADGDLTAVCIDSDAAAVTVESVTLSDGVDLAQEAAAAILDETAKALDREYSAPVGFMEAPYKIRRIKRKTIIKADDSAAWETVETTPIQEVYRAVRRAIMNSRAAQTDPRNGYSYIEDVATDPESGALETVYRRLGKYADLGGYTVDANGAEKHYTTDAQSVADYNAIVAALHLTDRQAAIVSLRMRGYGYKAIASYLGVTPRAVINAIEKVRAKAESVGFTPSTWHEMTDEQ